MIKKVMLFILLVHLLGCGNSSKQQAAECILIEIKPTSVYCGVLSVWVGMKFKKVVGEKEFIGLINCPETYDSTFFQEGNNYLIKMNSKEPSDKQNVIVNDFKKDNLLVYTIEEIKKQ